jgi:hypothetical protein
LKSVITYGPDRLRELEAILAERDRLLRSIAAMLDALGSGIKFQDPQGLCKGAARRIRDIVDRPGVMAGRR